LVVGKAVEKAVLVARADLVAVVVVVLSVPLEAEALAPEGKAILAVAVVTRLLLVVVVVEAEVVEPVQLEEMLLHTVPLVMVAQV
jgi:hypothetical protein